MRAKNLWILEVTWKSNVEAIVATFLQIGICSRVVGFCCLFPLRKTTGTKKENITVWFLSYPLYLKIYGYRLYIYIHIFLNRGMLHIIQKLYPGHLFLFFYCKVSLLYPLLNLIGCWIAGHQKRKLSKFISTTSKHFSFS